MATRAAATGLAGLSGSERGCRRKVLARQRASAIGAAEPEKPAGALHGQRATAWLAATGLATIRPAPRVDRIQPAGGGQRRFSPAATRPGFRTHRPARPDGVWAGAPHPLLANQSAPQIGARLHACAVASPAGRLCGCSAPPWEILAGTRPLNQGRFAFWGPLAVGPSRWLWRGKAHLDQRFMDGFETWRQWASRQSATRHLAPCRGCCGKLPAAPLSRALARLAPGREASSGGTQPHKTAKKRCHPAAAARYWSGLLQSLDGFPRVDDPWLDGPPHHPACLLGTSGPASGRVESAQPGDLAERPITPGRPAAAGPWPVCARCSTDLGAALCGRPHRAQLQVGEG